MYDLHTQAYALPLPFLAKQHALFSLRHAKFLPTPYQHEDSNRMTLAYFCLSSLALLPAAAVSTSDHHLSALDVLTKSSQRQGWADWIYEQQLSSGGFRGSDVLTTGQSDDVTEHSAAGASSSTLQPARTAAPASFSSFDTPHIIQSYTALLNLALSGDSFERLNRQGLLSFLASCQNADGSFSHFPGCEEAPDPRSTYSAFAIASMLHDWTTIDADQALSFLNSCRRFEGGFAQRSGSEANAGPTYCAVASFSLCSRLSDLPHPEKLLRWLVDRQIRPPPAAPASEGDSSSEVDEATEGQIPEQEMAGFQGRPNKPTDACYSFWNTAALQLLLPTFSPPLRLSDLIDPSLDRNWLLHCQHKLYGGIAREPGATPDVYHTYLSLAALSLGDCQGASLGPSVLDLRPLDPAWNVSKEVAERIKERLWRS
ncbi:hypothetical protein JCM11641_006676 [Rhodosporidiobolus odoratus]